MACCGYGSVTVTVDGRPYSVRGFVTLETSTKEVEAGANADGSLWKSTKRVPATATVSFDACNGDPEQLVGMCDVSATFEFDDAPSWVYPKAIISGKPSLNGENGELSGLVFNSANPRKVGRN